MRLSSNANIRKNHEIVYNISQKSKIKGSQQKKFILVQFIPSSIRLDGHFKRYLKFLFDISTVPKQTPFASNGAALLTFNTLLTNMNEIIEKPRVLKQLKAISQLLSIVCPFVQFV